MVADDGNEATKQMKIESDTLKVEREKAKDLEACLIIVRGSPQGKRHELVKDTMVMGRDFTADIPINDANVSRKHAVVFKEGGAVKVKDNGSTNGTFVNDKQVKEPVELHKEDMIRLGNTILKYLPKGELEIFYAGTLESTTHTDALTKVYNKGYIMDALAAEFKRAKALHTDFSVMIFDLDHFKKVNDTHGHDAGDMVLRESCAVLRGRIFPKNAIVGRFGGEEFLALLPDMDVNDAMDLGEHVRHALETNAFVYEGKRIPVTASVGIAELTADVETATALFKLADKAVYAAKSGGRNRVCKS